MQEREVSQPVLNQIITGLPFHVTIRVAIISLRCYALPYEAELHELLEDEDEPLSSPLIWLRAWYCRRTRWPGAFSPVQTLASIFVFRLVAFKEKP